MNALRKDDLETLIKEKPLRVIQRKIYEEPNKTLYDLTRRGRDISPGIKGINNLISMFVFSTWDIDKDEHTHDNKNGPYQQGILPLKKNNYSTRVLFNNHFPKEIYFYKDEKTEKERIIEEDELSRINDKNLEERISNGEIREVNTKEFLREAGSILIKNVFGEDEDIVKVFNYAHKKLLQTSFKRKGSNYIFAHSFRIAYQVKQTCEKYNKDTSYTKKAIITALLHDIVEEMTTKRKKKLSEIDEQTDYNPTEKDLKTMEKIRSQIKRKPELAEIKRLFGEDYQENASIITRSEKEYKDYIKKITNHSKIKFEKKSNDYDLVLFDKIKDGEDNLDTVTSMDRDKIYETQKKNYQICKQANKLVEDLQINKEDNPMLINELTNLAEKNLRSIKHYKVDLLKEISYKEEQTDEIKHQDKFSYKDILNKVEKTEIKMNKLLKKIIEYKNG